jgi:hypothetical protein
MKINDYLLYDNVTKKNASRDWGLKAATHRCDNTAIKSAFQNYAKSVLKDLTKSNCKHYELDGLIGGFSIPFQADGVRYVVCVSIAQADYAGRDSLAIVGFYCHLAEDLNQFLTAFDPVATARNLISINDMNGLQEGIDALTTSNDTRTHKACELLRHPEVKLFTDKDEANAIALNLMLTSNPPSILNASCCFDLPRWKEQNYDLVFIITKSSITMDKVRRYQNLREGEPPLQPVTRILIPPATPDKDVKPRSTSDGSNEVIWFSIAIACILAIGLVVYRMSGNSIIHINTQPVVSNEIVKPPIENTPHNLISINDKLSKLGDLTKTVSYHAIHSIKVLDQYSNDKQLILDEFVKLETWKKSLLEKMSYYSEKEIDESIRSKLLEKYKELKELSPKSCDNIKLAFGFEFTGNPPSITQQTCEVLDEFNKLQANP